MGSAMDSPQTAQVSVGKIRAFSGRGSLGAVVVKSSSKGASRTQCIRSSRVMDVCLRRATTRTPFPEARL